MHSLLEQYLEEISKGLGPLPLARRKEELREMRQHLLNAFIVNQEMGQSEDEAAANAVEQFGTPEELGENVVWAWRRERARDRRNLWLAALATPILASVLLFVGPYTACGLLGFVWPSYNAFFGHHMNVCREFAHGLFFFAYGLTGAILGAVVPRQAVRGAWLGMALLECGYLLWLGHPLTTSAQVYPFYEEDLSWWLTAVFFAWGVSRQRANVGRRARQA